MDLLSGLEPHWLQVFLAHRPQLPQLMLWAVLLGGVALFKNRSPAKAIGHDPQRHAAAPGWLARRRARTGLKHPKRGGVSVGYTSWRATAWLSWAEFRLGGILLGAPGSGKTTMLQRIIQAAAAMGSAAVIIDPKGSRQLRKTVTALGGIVWTIGGEKKWSPLEEDPELMTEQLLEGERVDPRAPVVFREGAALALAQLGQAMRRTGKRPSVTQIVEVLRDGRWADVCKRDLGADFRPLAKVEAEGVETFAAGLSRLMLGPAGRCVGNGPDAFTLRQAVAERKIVLFSLDTAALPDATRRVAGWAFLAVRAMLSDRLDEENPVPCLVAIDEAHRVGWTARLAVDILAIGREAHVPVVVASQGPSDVDELGHHMLERMVQDAGWRLIFRQGELDSARASRMLGAEPALDATFRAGGFAGVSVRRQEAYSLQGAGVGERTAVSPSALENLAPGTAWLRVPPIERKRGRVQCVRVALPDVPGDVSLIEGIVGETASGTAGDTVAANGEVMSPAIPELSPLTGAEQQALRRIRALVQERPGDECSPIVFPEGMKGTNAQGYPRLKIEGKYVYTYQLVWMEANGRRLGPGETVDHECHNRNKTCPGGVSCPHKLCHKLSHLGIKTGGRNNRAKEEQARVRRTSEAELARRDGALSRADDDDGAAGEGPGGGDRAAAD
jgi:hypothetical protein